MFSIFAVFFLVLGMLIGSFLNVVILRYNTGTGIGGRSGCFSCGKTLSWYELIPIVSFVIQRGKCRGCKAKISWQYPLVELLTGFVFLAIFLQYSNLLFSSPNIFAFTSHDFLLFLSSMVYFLVIWSLLIIIIVYDLRHKIIPDELVYAFSFLALLKVLSGLFTHSFSISALLAGPIFFIPFFLLWYISDGRWIGLGDGKLALGIGWLLGLGLGLSAIVVGFWAGAVIGLLLLLITRLKPNGKSLTMKSEIPFAPFLITGIAAVYFLGIDVVGLHRIFGL